MNIYRLHDDVFFIRYQYGRLCIDKMQVHCIRLTVQNVVLYDGYVYDQDNTIHADCEDVTRDQKELFKSKEDAITHLILQIDAEQNNVQ